MRDSFDKSCGGFDLHVSQPHPRWVTIMHRRYGTDGDEQELDAMTVDDLHDLQYVIERALDFCREVRQAQP